MLWIRIGCVLCTLEMVSPSLKWSSALSLVGILSPFHILRIDPLSVPSDIAVFVLVIIPVQVLKSMHLGANVHKILDTIRRDMGIYFMVITTSHLLIVVIYVTARVRFFALELRFDAC